jgi:tripeptide aminopeptidase
MGGNTIPFAEAAAETLLMRFLAVEGVTGHEAAIAPEVTAALVEAGVPQSAIKYDEAHKRIPLPTETGNLIATLPGTRPGPRLLFSTHLDTVPLCASAKPKREGTASSTRRRARRERRRVGSAVRTARWT